MKKLFQERKWLVFSLLAALCWGVWGTLAKFVSSDITPYTNHLLFTVGMLFTIPFVIRKCKRKEANLRGIIWGLVAGALAIIGNVAVYKSFAEGGLAAVVIPVTNLYPLVTILIAISVLKEKMHWLNALGILVVLPAIVLLSGQTEIIDNPSLFFSNLGLNTWLVFALIALLFWGFFSAAQKVSTNYVSAEWSYMSFIVSSVVISLGFMIFGLIDYDFTAQTFWVGSLAGMLNGLGVLCSFVAYGSEGKASKVTTVAGTMQPVFTIALAIGFLSERLGLIECIGIGLAILGSILLSVEKQNEELDKQ